MSVELGDKIVGLTLKEAKELSDYLSDVHGIKPAAAAVAVAAGPRPRGLRAGTRRAIGCPAREITTSSPASTRASSRERWVLASCTLTVMLGILT